jgi:hypothetical protein
MSRMLSQRMMQAPTDLVAYEAPPAAPTGAAARRRQATVAQNGEGGQERGGFGQWYANLSGWGKVRLALLILLILFLLGITVPAVLLALLYGPSRASGSVSRALAAVYSMGSYEVAAADRTIAREIALVDSQVPATPTYTPPPTFTPPVTPTAPPAATAAPLSTVVSQFIPAAPEAQMALAAPPIPTPAEAPKAAVRPRAWDNRLNQLGVTVEEAQLEPGQPYWRLLEGRWADEAESAGKHHIFVEVLDENGSRLVGQPVTVFWGGGYDSGPIEDKPAPDFGYNFQMYAAGYAYNVKVEGLPSDLVKGAGMGSIDQRFAGIHTSYYFVFQRSTK